MLTSDVLELAGSQYGALGTRQLRVSLGISNHAISRARRRGLVVDVMPGVVRIASAPDTFRFRCMAVQIGARTIGCVSGWSSAHLVGLRAMPDSTIHYTVPSRFRTRLPTWVHLHRCSWYEPSRDRMTLSDGLIVARPLRMLFGLAAAFNQHRFERAAEDAWHRGLVTPTEASAYLDRHRCRGKDGVSTFERWLEHALERPRPGQSNLERHLLLALEAIDVPSPRRQHPVTLRSGETIHLDIAWPNVRLGVEPGDSWWHGGDAGQRRDQARDRSCAELGWLIVRFDQEMRSDVRAAARQVGRIHRARFAELRNLPVL